MRKKAPPKIEELPVVVLTADTLIRLVDRMNALEQALKNLTGEVQGNFDYMAANMATCVEGGVCIKAFPVDGDGPIDVIVSAKEPSDAR